MHTSSYPRRTKQLCRRSHRSPQVSNRGTDTVHLTFTREENCKQLGERKRRSKPKVFKMPSRLLAWATSGSSSSSVVSKSNNNSKAQKSNPLLASSPRRVRLNSGGGEVRDDSSGKSPRRGRCNSRDIARTYSGLYGNQDDLLPFELNRQTTAPQSNFFMCATYISIVLLFQALAFLFFLKHSWTMTNIVHAVFSLIYMHWLKGSLYDDQGELDHLTVWEQLEGTKNTSRVREVLLIVPTVLTLLPCAMSDYDYGTCAINIFIWCICILAKLPFMNGVRIFGINRTAGIDDDDDNDALKKRR